MYLSNEEKDLILLLRSGISYEDVCESQDLDRLIYNICEANQKYNRLKVIK